MLPAHAKKIRCDQVIRKMSEMLELGIIFFSLLIGVILTMRMRLPPVIGILLVGAVIGPFALGLVKEDETINIFSDIGAILLLFIIGIEFSLSKIIKFGMRALLLAFVKLMLVFIVMYEVSLIFGLPPVGALLIATLFSFSSTTFFSRLIKDKELSYGDEANLLFAVLILEDVIAVFALAVLSATPINLDTKPVFNEFVLSIVKSLLALMICYVLLQKVVKIFFMYFARVKTTETIIFASLSICALFVFLATYFGFDASIGAFLAGSIVESLREFKSIEKSMLPFGLFFSSFFFLSMGMLVNPASIYANFALILVLFIINSIVKFVSVGAGVYLLGSNLRASIFSGISMLTVGEFSLLIAKKAPVIAGLDVIGVVSASVFLSALLSGVLMKEVTTISMRATFSIPTNIRSTGRRLSRYLGAVLTEFEPDGSVFKLFIKERTMVLYYSIILLLINCSLFLFCQMLENIGLVSFDDMPALIGRIALHAIFSAGILIKLLGSLDKILTSVADTFRRVHSISSELNKKAIYDGVAVLVFLEIAVILPFVFSFMQLPEFFGYLAIAPLVFSMVFLWDFLSTIRKMIGSRKKISAYMEYKARKASLFGLFRKVVEA